MIMLKFEQKKCVILLILSTVVLPPQGCPWLSATWLTQGAGQAGSFLREGGCAALPLQMVEGATERKARRPNTFLFLFLSFSKGIADYITRCRQAIGKFESLVHQIQKNADDISSRLTLIESINLFKYPAPKSGEELPGRPDSLVL